MIDHKTFEKRAKQNGYNLTVDYRDYPSAIPMVEAMVGNKLDFGMWGNTPIIRVIAQNQPLSVLTMGEGHFRFVLATRKGSPIHSMQDLKGKTVGVLFGGDPQNAFGQMLRWTLGSADPGKYGIKLVNTPTQAQAATIPKGTDADVVTYPAFLAEQQRDPDVVGIINSFGYTESYYDGPAGKGAGHLIAEVKNSPFYPDGFYLHRSFWVVRNQLIDQYPKVVEAFMEAYQEATAALAKMNAGDVSQLVKQYWNLPPDAGAKVVKDELLFIRGWVWTTEADAYALMWVSQFMTQEKQIDKPLEWTQVVQAFQKGAQLQKEAYAATGNDPAASVFTEKTTTDKRGLPVWDSAKWKAPPSVVS
jgi:ABC-type nitrate/sulfonate/bicarbonate transport system substrate-binding protein